jgi:hypothetical protein
MKKIPGEKLAVLEGLDARIGKIAQHAEEGQKGPPHLALKSRAGVLVLTAFMEWFKEELYNTDHSVKQDEHVFLCAAEILAMCLFAAQNTTSNQDLKSRMFLAFTLLTLELGKK